jgi:hypothetical protein
MVTKVFVGGVGVSSVPSVPLICLRGCWRALRSLMAGEGGGSGLKRAAASFAAIFEGEGARSTLLVGRPRVLELDVDEDFASLLVLLGALLGALPPVVSLLSGLCAPVPTLVAASRAPLRAPVYVLVAGLGAGAGLAKAEPAPMRAASRTLCCVSPVDCGARLRLLAELIGSPSEWQCGDSVHARQCSASGEEGGRKASTGSSAQAKSKWNRCHITCHDHACLALTGPGRAPKIALD